MPNTAPEKGGVRKMIFTPQMKAETLIEALPYIKEFYGKTVVIKYGGAAMKDCKLKEAVIQDVVLMKFVGMHPVLVHGGGPAINELLSRLGYQSRFVNGMRVTDAPTMEIVEMVLAGKINKEIVSLIHRFGGKAVGLTGKDGNLLVAEKKKEIYQGQEVDLGLVGQIVKVNPEVITTVIPQGYIPVIAPIAAGEGDQSFNINADYVASFLAKALKADKLVLLTDVKGVMAEEDKPESLISALKVQEVKELMAKGVIKGGMIPKLNCAVEAVEGGVRSVHIIDGRLPHSLLLEIFTDEGIGTMVGN